jgi:Cu+-exporting ATPase
MQMDPVCGMQIDEQQEGEKSEYQGKTFNFCSPTCKQQFDQNPQRYAPPKTATKQ